MNRPSALWSLLSCLFCLGAIGFVVDNRDVFLTATAIGVATVAAVGVWDWRRRARERRQDEWDRIARS
jgi:uncharacterized membrane protein